MKNLDELKHYLRHFAQLRDWQQFHSPKNLSMALAVEAAEILEHFQWLTEAQCQSLEEEKLNAIADEIADVQMYLVLLADRLNIDILAAAKNKSLKNEQKYPVDKVKGSAKKYHDYE